MAEWYDNYLDKGQGSVIKSLENDNKLSLEDLQGLLDYEREHDNRMKLVEYLMAIITSKKKDTQRKKLDIPKKEGKNMAKEEKVYALWNEGNRTNGIQLPSEVGGFSLSKRRPIQITEEAADYIEKTYDKESYQFLNQKDYDKFFEDRKPKESK